ncbi:LOW QUALITY PROTEIN: hypothetical protein ElyMa_006521800 [Elysia marginata]|uniref:Uncharacterized protein n=1 Tax=Elysia marginata TaxID=1093978 RepID=A0AAV4IA15_9GAST|nr:LOW QUALITY PROTEIN: hypothetical protein ElyMa_006521800 [Elysia marginata]
MKGFFLLKPEKVTTSACVLKTSRVSFLLSLCDVRKVLVVLVVLGVTAGKILKLPSPPTILGQRCRVEGGGGSGGCAAAHVSSPGIVLRAWSFSPRALFSFSSSSSSSSKSKPKKKHLQQHQQAPSLPTYHQQHLLQYSCSSNSSPSPVRRQWCDGDKDDGVGDVDVVVIGLGSHYDYDQSRDPAMPRSVSKTTTSLSLPLTPRPPVHTSVPRDPPVVPNPPSRAQQQQRKMEKPEKDKFRFRRWHLKKRKRNGLRSFILGSRPHQQQQQVEGDYHRLAHHLGQGYYKDHRGAEGRVQGRGGSLSHSCTDTSSCSNSGLHQGSDGGGFGAGSSSLEDGGSSSNDCHYNSSSSKVNHYNSSDCVSSSNNDCHYNKSSSKVNHYNSSSCVSSSNNDCHYNNSSSKVNHYNSSSCVSSSNNGSNRHFNSIATNHCSSSGRASSSGIPVIDCDQYYSSHVYNNNNSSSCNGGDSSPSLGPNGTSDDNGEVFSPGDSFKVFGFNQVRSQEGVNIDTTTRCVERDNIAIVGDKASISEVLIEYSNTASPALDSFGLVADNQVLKTCGTPLPSGNSNHHPAEYPSLAFPKQECYAAPPRYSEPTNVSSSSSSNIPCSFVDSVAPSPLTDDRSKNGFLKKHSVNDSFKYQPDSSDRSESHTCCNNNNYIEDEITKETNDCASCDGSPLGHKGNEGGGCDYTNNSNNGNSHGKILFLKSDSSAVNASRGILTSTSNIVDSDNSVDHKNSSSTSSVDEFLGSSKLDLLTPPGPNGLTALDVYLGSRDRRVMVRVCALLWLLKLDQDRAVRARLRYQEEQRRKVWMRRLAGRFSTEETNNAGLDGTASCLPPGSPAASPGESSTKIRQILSAGSEVFSEAIPHSDSTGKRRIVCKNSELRSLEGFVDDANKGNASSSGFETAKEVKHKGSKNRANKDNGIKGRVGYEWRNAVLRRGRKYNSVTPGCDTNSGVQRVTTNSFYRRSYRSDTNDAIVNILEDDGENSSVAKLGKFRRRVYSDEDYKYQPHTSSGLSLALRPGPVGASQTLDETRSSVDTTTPAVSPGYFVGVMDRYGDDHCFHRKASYGRKPRSPRFHAGYDGGTGLNQTNGHLVQLYDKINSRSQSPTRRPSSDAVLRTSEVLRMLQTKAQGPYAEEIAELRAILSSSNMKIDPMGNDNPVPLYGTLCISSTAEGSLKTLQLSSAGQNTPKPIQLIFQSITARLNVGRSNTNILQISSTAYSQYPFYRWVD